MVMMSDNEETQHLFFIYMRVTNCKTAFDNLMVFSMPAEPKVWWVVCRNDQEVRFNTRDVPKPGAGALNCASICP